MAQQPFRPRMRNDFKVAVICALPLEAGMVQYVFDKEWDIHTDLGKAQGDGNTYSFGVIGKHNIVLLHMPGMGNIDSAIAATSLRTSFTNIEITFLVGICGANPKNTAHEGIVLGDCIVSTAIVQYDFGRQYPGQFERKADLEHALGRATPMVRGFLAKLQATQTSKTLAKRLAEHLKSVQQKETKALYPGLHRDRLFEAEYLHTHHSAQGGCDQCIKEVGICARDCDAIGCDEIRTVKRFELAGSEHLTADHFPKLHFGRYGSANTVLKSGLDRDHYAAKDSIIGFEMEGAGIWETTPTIIVKSACDYADSHKNKEWHVYAAATAASGLKAILEQLTTTDLLRRDYMDRPRQISFNVPNSLVAHFVHRTEILTELDRWMNSTEDRTRLILRGMGGAGKSQIALECCRRAEASKRFTTVLWIDASSVLSVQQSFKLFLSGLDESSIDSNDSRTIVTLVTQALRRKGAPWLAVFDNFDYPNVFRYDPITNYVPTAENGKILFTSRNASSSRLGRVISISGMTDRESLDLLLKRRPQDSTEKEMGLRIAAELGHLALALDQAEAYIRSRNLSLEDFITHFRKRKRTILREIPQNWEYRTSKTSDQSTLLSAFTTWELSFEQISGPPKIKQSKEHFLTLCAYFDLASISKEYFEFYCQTSQKEWTSIFKSDGEWGGFLFDDVTAECRTLSLLQTEEDHGGRGPLALHPLIREWLKLRKIPSEQQEFAREFTDVLMSYIEAIDFDTSKQPTKQRLIANIVSCVQEGIDFGNMRSVEFPSRVAVGFGNIYDACGFYNEAEQLYQQALTNYLERVGSEHSDTLSTMSRLANIYQKTGRYNKAVELYKQVSDIHKKLGFENLFTLENMEGLALAYGKMGRYDEAEDLYKYVLAGMEEELGFEHSTTLATMSNLASIHLRRGVYDKAEELYTRALIGMKEKLGYEHYSTLPTMSALGIVYARMGRFDEAEDIYRQALTGMEKTVGPDHPYTLMTMSSLAVLYHNQKRYDDAEKLHKQTLAAYQARLGHEHPHTLRVMLNLASTYRSQERFNDAEELNKQAIAGMEEKLGSDHPDTIQAANQLASIRAQMDRESGSSILEHVNESESSSVENMTERERLIPPG